MRFTNCVHGPKLFGDIIRENGYVIDAQDQHLKASR
jgi:hypothetical protein